MPTRKRPLEVLVPIGLSEIKRFYGQSVAAGAVKKERQKMARSQPEAVPGRGKALRIIS